jgi:hypothetical protein
MPRSSAPCKIRLVGQSYDHPRYILRDARHLLDHFYTGRGWSRDLSQARLYADPELANKTAQALTVRHLRRHEPKRLFLLTAVVRVHAPEDVTRADVENYLKDALVVGVDHKRYGTGPTADSLVEVVVPVISLEEAR